MRNLSDNPQKVTQDQVNIENFNGEKSLMVVPGSHHTDAIHLDANNISAATTGFLLVDVSNTGGQWKHLAGTLCQLHFISIDLNPDSTFAGSVQIGFLDDVDADNGDLHTLKTWHFDRDRLTLVDFLDFSMSHFECSTDHFFGPITANDTTWQTDVAIQCPSGANIAPGNGDMVMKIIRTAGAIDVGITVGYHVIS